MCKACPVVGCIALVLAVLLVCDTITLAHLRGEHTELQRTAVQLRREAADLKKRVPHDCDMQFLLRVSRDMADLTRELCEQVGAPVED